MNAYVPSSPTVLVLTGLVLVGTVLGVLAIERLRPDAPARVAAWLLVVVATVGVERLCRDEPAGFRMVAVIGAALWAMKAVVLVEARASGLKPLPPGRWLGFVVGWPGMQPRAFAERGNAPRRGAGELAWRGARWLLLGAAMLALARLAWVATGSRALATALALPALSLMLHFGLFNLVAAGWRRAGINAYALFRAPLLSQSLTEFWGRRWNLAFSEMTAIGVYRPLAARFGVYPGLVASFAVSGLLHELAISVPVKAGFGLPLLYFALHGALMLLERALAGRGRAIGGAFGRAWTIAWLVLPLPILFHPWFLAGTVWPLLGASS